MKKIFLLATAIISASLAVDNSLCKSKFNLSCEDLYSAGYDEDEKQNFSKALKYYSVACEAGYKGACTNLGFMYDSANGVRQDYKMAAKLYQKGCDLGELMACSNLGELYKKGRIVMFKDYSMAIKLYKAACDVGEAIGCANLAEMYENGYGVEKDLTKAGGLYRRACDRDDFYGCYRFAKYSENVLKDSQKAAKFYGRACSIGSSDSSVQQNAENKGMWNDACNKYDILR